MTKVYGTGTYDFRRHRVAEYPVEALQQPAEDPQKMLPSMTEKTTESKPGSNIPSSITLAEIQRDRLTKIAASNWAKSGEKKMFSPEIVQEIYYTELTVKGGRKPVPLQRVMILEVSQYLENYLWPNFDPEASSFEHVMSMILMVNEKVSCFMWLVIRRACLTHEALQRRGLQICSRCFPCEKEAELNNHLFLHCITVINLWNMFLCMLGVNWTMPKNTFDLLRRWETIGRRDSEEDGWKLIPACIWWALWRERNAKCFEGKINNIHRIKRTALAFFIFWCKQDMVLRYRFVS